MDKSTSIYLDTIRFLASLAVFFHHVFELGVVTTDLRINFAREAVMVFFVLSGFVISFVAKNKEHNLQDYMVGRLSRLYSVVLPALLLTLLLDTAGMAISPSLYDMNAHQNVFARMVISLLYLNQMWNLTVFPLSNGPFWSISYEFWYYLIFACVFYIHGKKGALLAVILMLLIGPKMLLLFPCWLIGVGAYKIYCGCDTDSLVWRIAFPISLLTMFFVIEFGYPTQWIVNIIQAHLHEGYFEVFGQDIFIGGHVVFLNDYLFCMIFAVSILSASAFFKGFIEVKLLTRVIRYLFGNTFSLYLYHVPLLIFFQTVFYESSDSRFYQILILLLTLIVVFLLARVTEQKKSMYVTFFNNIIVWVSARKPVRKV